MNIIHIIYEQSGERFDFCEDEDNKYHIDYDKAEGVLTVKHWNRMHNKGRNAHWPTVVVFFSPCRYVKDWTL